MEKETLQELIAENNIETFFNIVGDIFNIFSIGTTIVEVQQLKKEVILMSQNHYFLRKNFMKGIITFDNYQIQNNKLLDRLLGLLDEFDKYGLFAMSANKSTNLLLDDQGLQRPNIFTGFQIEQGVEKERIYDLGCLFQRKKFLKGGRFTNSSYIINDINIVEANADNSVFLSRKHFTLEYIESGNDRNEIIIYDGHFQREYDPNSVVRSKNGFKINGKPMLQSFIKIGDEIQLGNILIKVIEL